MNLSFPWTKKLLPATVSTMTHLKTRLSPFSEEQEFHFNKKTPNPTLNGSRLGVKSLIYYFLNKSKNRCQNPFSFCVSSTSLSSSSFSIRSVCNTNCTTPICSFFSDTNDTGSKSE